MLSWKRSLFLISRATMALVDIQIPLLRAPHGFPQAVDWYKPWMVKFFLLSICIFHELAFRPHKTSESAHSFCLKKYLVSQIISGFVWNGPEFTCETHKPDSFSVSPSTSHILTQFKYAIL